MRPYVESALFLSLACFNGNVILITVIHPILGVTGNQCLQSFRCEDVFEQRLCLHSVRLLKYFLIVTFLKQKLYILRKNLICFEADRLLDATLQTMRELLLYPQLTLTLGKEAHKRTSQNPQTITL